MNTPCPPSLAKSRQIEACFLRALAERGQSATAEAAGVSETRLSRFKSDENKGGLDLAEVARVLAALNLRVLTDCADGVTTVPRESWDALHVLLRDYADGVVAGRVA